MIWSPTDHCQVGTAQAGPRAITETRQRPILAECNTAPLMLALLASAGYQSRVASRPLRNFLVAL